LTHGVVATAAVAAPVALFTTVPLATIAVGVIAGGFLAWRRSGVRTIVAVCGIVLVLYSAPHLVQMLSAHIGRLAEVLSTVAFAGALASTAVVVAYLVRKRRRWLAVAVAAAAGIVLPQVATMSLVWLSGQQQIAGAPWTWYWIAMLPTGPWRTAFPEAVLFTVDDVVAWYPAVFTLCASLVLTRACVLGRRPVGDAVDG
jgi:hypothetical protein